MKKEQEKQLKYLYESLEGEAWQIRDSPEELMSFYNIALKGEVSVKNNIAELRWNIDHAHASQREYPVFQAKSGAEMHLQVDKCKRQKQLEVLRSEESESISLKVLLATNYWHHIKALTTKFETITPALDPASSCHQCDCEGCEQKQKCIQHDPSEHPFYAVLQYIMSSDIDYFFSLEGKTLGAGAMFTPLDMVTHHGVCKIQSTLTEIVIDLSQLYFIRVEQRTLDGVPHAVVQGRNYKHECCFSILSPEISHYRTWAEIVTQAKIVC